MTIPHIGLLNSSERMVPGLARVFALSLVLIGHCACKPASEVMEGTMSNRTESPSVTQLNKTSDVVSYVWNDVEMEWHEWGVEAFTVARRTGRPVLLYLAAPGCEGVFSDVDDFTRAVVRDHFVGVRVDPFRRPDLARRYEAGGWPALVLLTPEGTAFTMAVDVAPDVVGLYLWRLAENYTHKRSVILARLASQPQTNRSNHAIDIQAVYQAASASYDTLHGGFGAYGKAANAWLLLFLLDFSVSADDTKAWEMVQGSLDALMKSPLRDAQTGLFAAYSHAPDWRAPALERDAADQAGLLLCFLRASRRDRIDYREVAMHLVQGIATHFFDSHRGVFHGRQVATAQNIWWTSPGVYAGRNALMISAMIAADRELNHPRARVMATQAAEYFLTHSIDASGSLVHWSQHGHGPVSGLLVDQALLARALWDVYTLTGREEFQKGARQLLAFMDKMLFSEVDGAYHDRLPAAEPMLALLPYADRLLPAGNVVAAELMLDLKRFERVATLLGGKRLSRQLGRAHASYARVLMRYQKIRPSSL